LIFDKVKDKNMLASFMAYGVCSVTV